MKISEKIDSRIKSFAKELNIDIDEIILNEKIEIKDLNMEKYTLDDLIKNISKILENIKLNDNLILEILKFVPTENHPFYKENKDIKNIYIIYFNKEIKSEIIVDTKIESFWTIIKKKILNYIQSQISQEKKISSHKINKYIEMMNQYNQYFDFEKYELLPNVKIIY